MWYVYILKSLKDHKRYIGSTNDLERRFNQHQVGLVRSTKYRRPFVKIFHEEFDTETEARMREKYFKTHKGFIELEKLLN